MLDTAKPQLNQDIFTKQQKPLKDGENPRDVWQDKIGVSTDREASSQPASVNGSERSPGSKGRLPRSQRRVSRPRKAVPLQLWVDPIDKAEIQRQAELTGLSVSAVGAALLAEILRQKLHVQQAATIETVIEQAVMRSNRRLATRLAWLLMRIAFDTGQTRVLATNTLGFQEGMNEAHLKEILETADKRTKANLTRRTPQLTELMRSVEAWLLEEGEEETHTNGGR